MAPDEESRDSDARDKTLAGQRKISLIWETTQALISLSIVGAYVAVAIHGAWTGVQVENPMTSPLFLVLGFYFARTNHQAIGGGGSKANVEQEYRGR